tara:strand:- start:21 stop:209 length:189 start_codon:yes stop_codon:yes gene_type:complete
MGIRICSVVLAVLRFAFGIHVCFSMAPQVIRVKRLDLPILLEVAVIILPVIAGLTDASMLRK